MEHLPLLFLQKLHVVSRRLMRRHHLPIECMNHRLRCTGVVRGLLAPLGPSCCDIHGSGSRRRCIVVVRRRGIRLLGLVAQSGFVTKLRLRWRVGRALRRADERLGRLVLLDPDGHRHAAILLTSAP